MGEYSRHLRRDSVIGVTAGASAPGNVTENIEIIIDGGGSVIEAGEKGHIKVDWASTIQGVTTMADTAGDISIDIWKTSVASHPAADGDSITASAPPTITNSTIAEDTDLSGWATALSAGDILAFNVDSCNSITRATVALKVQRT